MDDAADTAFAFEIIDQEEDDESSITCYALQGDFKAIFNLILNNNIKISKDLTRTILDSLPTEFGDAHKIVFDIFRKQDLVQKIGVDFYKLQLDAYYKISPYHFNTSHDMKTLIFQFVKDVFDCNNYSTVQELETIINLSNLEETDKSAILSKCLDSVDSNMPISMKSSKEYKRDGERIHDHLIYTLEEFQSIVIPNQELGIYSVDEAQIKKDIENTKNINYYVVFTGVIKVGKSSVINSIIGRDICPLRSSPMTIIPLIISHRDMTQFKEGFKEVSHLQLAVLHIPHLDRYKELIQRIRKYNTPSVKNSLPPDLKQVFETVIDPNYSLTFQENDNIGTTDKIYDIVKFLNDVLRIVYKVESWNQNSDLNILKEFSTVADLPRIEIQFEEEFIPAHGNLHLIDTAGINEHGLSGDLVHLLESILKEAACTIYISEINKFDSKENNELLQRISMINKDALTRTIVLLNQIDLDSNYTSKFISIISEKPRPSRKEKLEKYKHWYSSYKNTISKSINQKLKHLGIYLDQQIIPYSAQYSIFANFWDQFSTYYLELDSLPTVDSADKSHKWFFEICDELGVDFLTELYCCEDIEARNEMLEEITTEVEEFAIKGGKDILNESIKNQTVCKVGPERMYIMLSKYKNELRQVIEKTCKTKKNFEADFNILQKQVAILENMDKDIQRLISYSENLKTESINQFKNQLPNKPPIPSIPRLSELVAQETNPNFKAVLDGHRNITGKDIPVKKEEYKSIIQLRNQKIIDALALSFKKIYTTHQKKFFDKLKKEVNIIKEKYQTILGDSNIQYPQIETYSYTYSNKVNVIPSIVESQRMRWFWFIPLFLHDRDIVTEECLDSNCLLEYITNCENTTVEHMVTDSINSFTNTVDRLLEVLNIFKEDVVKNKMQLQNHVTRYNERKLTLSKLEKLIEDMTKIGENMDNVETVMKEKFPDVINEVCYRQVLSQQIGEFKSEKQKPQGIIQTLKKFMGNISL